MEVDSWLMTTQANDMMQVVEEIAMTSHKKEELLYMLRSNHLPPLIWPALEPAQTRKAGSQRAVAQRSQWLLHP